MSRWNLNYMKLRDKLLLMYVLSVFIPIVVTNVVFYQATTANIRSQKTRDAGVALNNLKNELRVTIDQGVGLSYSLYADPVFTIHYPACSKIIRSTFGLTIHISKGSSLVN